MHYVVGLGKKDMLKYLFVYFLVSLKIKYTKNTGVF